MYNTRVGIFMTIAVVLMLNSCLGAKIHTSFNRDGSGSILMEFKISQIFYQMGAAEGGKGDSIPLSADQLREDLGDQPGVSVREVSEEVGEEFNLIRAVLDFENFVALEKTDVMGDAVLSHEGKRWIFRQKIADESEPSDEEVSEEELAQMKPFFEGYEISFIVTAPKKVISYNMGELSSDGRTVTYSVPTLEMNMLGNTEDLVMEVIW